MHKFFYKVAKLAYKTLLVYWFLFRPKTFGVKILIMNGGKFLLIRQSYGSTKIWTLPGGGFDPKKESAKSASVREVFEELGIKLNEDSLVELPKLYTEAEYKRDTVCIYFADISGINIQLRTNLEISEVKFCTKEEMKELNLSRIVKFAMEGLSK